MLETCVEPIPSKTALPRPGVHPSNNSKQTAVRLLGILLLTCFAFLILGYHPGVEDDFVYLAAIKHDLNPALFPHDLPFVTDQLQFTCYDTMVASFVRHTPFGLAVSVLLWQFSGLFVLLLCCWHIAAHCFAEESARWAGTAFVAVMLALPVSTSDLFLADQHLHPRLLATDCILLAVLAILRGHAFALLAVPCLIVGVVLHPLMTLFGCSLCLWLALAQAWQPSWQVLALQPFRAAAAILPNSWLWEKPTAAWQRAAAPRALLYLYKWPWYGWLGIVGPMGLVAWLRNIAARREETNLRVLLSGLLGYAVFQFVVALLILLPQSPAWFLQMEPMRFLHLLYLLTALLCVAALGRFWLKDHAWRWAIVFLPLAVGMYVDQQAEFAGSPHIEWPGQSSANPWLQSFAWVREHTPEDAYFALDPRYTDAPLEGVHSFRALAERSALADGIKDPGIVTHVAHLAPRWIEETDATRNLQHFQAADFKNLEERFGVNWVLLDHQVQGLACPYHNDLIWVCKLG